MTWLTASPFDLAASTVFSLAAAERAVRGPARLHVRARPAPAAPVTTCSTYGGPLTSLAHEPVAEAVLPRLESLAAGTDTRASR